MEPSTPDDPVLDDHLHLDPIDGKGAEGAAEFAAAGGTHMLVCNKPARSYGGEVTSAGDFRTGYDHTVDVVEAATERLPGRAWAVLGVHPTLISRLLGRGYTAEEAADLMRAGLDVAADYVGDGTVVALKSGRPHYDVDHAVWEASNAVMRHAFELGAAAGCAVQLHTEDGEAFPDIARWAREAGTAPERVVKHYAAGRCEGPTPSVLADREELERAAGREAPFMMETDFVDDPDRPGAVLGPKTVPKRTRWLAERGHDYGDGTLERAHVETPRTVYGIDTRATLG